MGLLYDRGPGLPFNLALLILQDKIQLTRTKTKQNKTFVHKFLTIQYLPLLFKNRRESKTNQYIV